ncbi:MAG: hypothetical protein FJX57_19705, partial [Alphaproteobacteria bacterium]|nr:hypothetical protein [Alphaproteobacteria bacterium]
MAARKSSRLYGAFLLALAAASPSAAAPVVNCNVVGTKDTPMEYAAEGPMSTAVGIPAAPVNGPPCNIPAFADADGNVDWRFAVRHQASGFTALQAVDAQLMVSGQHVRAPHPAAPHLENAPNFLPEIGSAKFNIPAGKTAALSTFAGPKHGTTHRDFYSAASEVKYDVIGVGGELSGTVKVSAFHQDVKPPSFTAGAAIKDAGVSSVSFDAATGTLSFKPGPVDALNLQGGITGGIDPRYAGDPMLDAVFAISDLTLLGVNAD